MNTYQFYQDPKVSCWERTHFEVKAESYEEAVALVRSWQGEDVLVFEDDKQVFFLEYEPLYETSKALIPEENGGRATIEVFDCEGKEIYNNTPNK